MQIPPAAGKELRMSTVFLGIAAWLIVQLPLAMLVGAIMHCAGRVHKLSVQRIPAKGLRAHVVRAERANRTWRLSGL
jgi:hypothetical protein